MGGGEEDRYKYKLLVPPSRVPFSPFLDYFLNSIIFIYQSSIFKSPQSNINYLHHVWIR